MHFSAYGVTFPPLLSGYSSTQTFMRTFQRDTLKRGAHISDTRLSHENQRRRERSSLTCASLISRKLKSRYSPSAEKWLRYSEEGTWWENIKLHCVTDDGTRLLRASPTGDFVVPKEYTRRFRFYGGFPVKRSVNFPWLLSPFLSRPRPPSSIVLSLHLFFLFLLHKPLYLQPSADTLLHVVPWPYDFLCRLALDFLLFDETLTRSSESDFFLSLFLSYLRNLSILWLLMNRVLIDKG